MTESNYSAPPDAERLLELSGRFMDDGMNQEDADRQARKVMRADALAPIPLSEVQRIDRQRIWFWDGIFTTGLSIIAAKKGLLKSWLALRLGIALADGRPFLGKCTRKANVLYLALELDEIAIAERARLCGDVRGCFDVLFSFRRGHDALVDLAALVDARGYRVVIVDMLPAILPAGTDGNAYDEVTSFMLELRRFAQSRELSIICLLHAGKTAREDFADAVMGSTGFAGQADTVAVLQRKRGDSVLKFLSTGNHGADQAFKIRIGENVSMEILEESELEKQTAYLSAEQERVLMTMTEFYPEGVTPVVLAGVLGKTSDAVRIQLNRLIERGAVKRIGRGVYQAKCVKPDETNEHER
jgi:RecA-family ATPase